MVDDIAGALTEEEWPCLVTVSLEIREVHDADRAQVAFFFATEDERELASKLPW